MGGIDITRRSPDPSHSDTHFTRRMVLLEDPRLYYTKADDQVIDSTCEDSRTIGLSFYSIVSSGCFNSTPPPRFTGWALKDPAPTRPGGVTVWSWDLSPRLRRVIEQADG